MPAPNDPSNVLPFPAQVLATARAAGMLRKAASEIRALKAPPATVEPAAPTTGGAA